MEKLSNLDQHTKEESLPEMLQFFSQTSFGLWTLDFYPTAATTCIGILKWALLYRKMKVPNLY